MRCWLVNAVRLRLKRNFDQTEKAMWFDESHLPDDITFDEIAQSSGGLEIWGAIKS